ncbi:MAG: hypothetical protein SGI86_20395 [Deltaproteobacteria bacterium]|nr:hypothetical protein [Deltaproteobacteria bacterium]
MRRPALFLLVALGLTGCSSKAVDPKAQALADAICPKAYSCCESQELADNDWAGTSVETCRSKTASGFDGEFARARSSEKKGRSRLLPSRIDACIATIKNASCDTLNVTNHFSGVTGCDGFIEPLVAAGGQCSDDAECLDGRCEIPEDGPVGKCLALAGAGKACVDSDDCARGLLCHGLDRTCVLPRANGVACSSSSECASFDCDTDGSGGQQCVAPPPDECFYASACSFGRARPGFMAVVFVGLCLALAMRRRLR